MISDDEFTGKVGVHLQYADTLSTAECLRVLLAHLNAGTWIQAPEDWFNIASFVSQRDDATTSHLDLLLRWVANVETGPISSAAQRMLPQVISWARRANIAEHDLERIVRWFVQTARPGHAGTCADILSHNPGVPATDGGPKVLERIFLPLVVWLLQNGAAELRSSRRRDLVPKLIDAVRAHGRQDLLEVALRYLVVGGHVVSGWSWNRPAGQWPAVEDALALGAPPSLAVDACVRLVDRREPSREQIWCPLLQPQAFPRCRRALIDGLAGGSFQSRWAQEAWPFAAQGPLPDPAPRFGRPGALEDARGALHQALATERQEFTASGHAVRWLGHIAGEVARIYELGRRGGGHPDALRGLGQLVGWDETVNQILADTLTNALAATREQPDISLALKILTQPGKLSRRVAAAIRCLPAPDSVAVPRSSPDLNLLQEEFTRILNLPWDGRTFGIPVADLLGSAKNVRFEQLKNDDKVQVDADVVLLDVGYYHETGGCQDSCRTKGAHARVSARRVTGSGFRTTAPTGVQLRI